MNKTYQLILLTYYLLVTFSSNLVSLIVKLLKANDQAIFPFFPMDVDPGNKYMETFRGGVQWYMIESEDFFSNTISTKGMEMKNIFFDGQSISLRLSIKTL